MCQPVMCTWPNSTNILRKNISRFSKHSETLASEFLENIEVCYYIHSAVCNTMVCYPSPKVYSSFVSHFLWLLCFTSRHPIPDYYSITLEIARDRITAASPNTCNSKDPNVPECPADSKDGDTYLHRTLNEACQKMVRTKSSDEQIHTSGEIFWRFFLKICLAILAEVYIINPLEAVIIMIIYIQSIVHGSFYC